MDGYSFVYVSFLRDRYCLYPFWNSSRSKNCLGCKKTHGFVGYSVTHRMRPPSPQKVEISLFESGVLLRELWRPCHLMGAELSDRLFGQNYYYFFTFLIYVYVCFVGNVAAPVWLVSVWLIIHTKQLFFFLSFYYSNYYFCIFSGQINHLWYLRFCL